jgi:hypothetical protein
MSEGTATDQRFAGAYAKLDRAEEHLAELRRALEAHMRRPDLVVGTIAFNAETGRIVGNYRVQAVPPRVQAIAGDVIQNLRIALEYVIYQLVLAHGGQPTNQTKFPILKRRGTVTIVGGVGAATLAVVESVQPYNGEEWEYVPAHPLAQLQHMSNTDKHRTLIQGRHGLDQLVMGAGREGEDDRIWEARIVLGDLEDRGTKITLEALPGSGGGVSGSAWYTVWVEYAPPLVGVPEGEEPPDHHEELLPLLTELAHYTRTLLGWLVATIESAPAASAVAAGPAENAAGPASMVPLARRGL